MPPNHEPAAQWTLDVTVWHEPTFGHVIHARTLGRHGGWKNVGTWRWTGLGVPDVILSDLTSRIHGVISEHLVTRYGVQGTLTRLDEGGSGPA